MNPAFSYSDVLIKPKFSSVATRTGVSLHTDIGNISLSLPVISANMWTITGPNMVQEMTKAGGLSILPRSEKTVDEFTARDTAVSMFINSYTHKEADIPYINPSVVGVSIGVSDSDRRLFDTFIEMGARIICIDVAHGHSLHTQQMLQWITKRMGDERSSITVIAGNIATGDALYDLTVWGADAVKVGIGPGKNCTTRSKTGVGIPQLYALQECHHQRMGQTLPISIIADGGIREVGDIAKALKFSDAVMIGSMISGTSETPGPVFKGDNGLFYKQYSGSASAENKGHTSFVEGITTTIPFKGKVKYILAEIKDGLQSALSYTGSQDLKEFRNNCEFIHITSNAAVESKI